MVFGAENRLKLKTLEALIHPAVGRHFEKWLEAHQKDKIVANLVPQLYEAGLEGRYDKILVITTSPELQLSRLSSRYPELNVAALKQRIEAQMPQEQKSAHADYLIDNKGSEADLRLQIKVFLEKLRQY
jgi:dephospho-CoA kinase